LRSKSFQKNLFMSIGGIFILFAICFSVYQYQREKEYKIDILHSRLQMFNYEMMQSLGEEGLLSNAEFHDFTARHSIEGLRVTIINFDGRVLQDNDYNSTDSLATRFRRLY